MSAFIAKDELQKRLGDTEFYGVLLDETTVINLPIVMAMLGLSEESAKKWYMRYGLAKMPGRTWPTNGRRFFQAMERYFDELETQSEAG